jgi:uncharacterized protein (TIGR03437 family)
VRKSFGIILTSASFLAVLSTASNAQTIQWARQFGSSRVDEAFAVATGPDGVYVAGETFGAFPGFSNTGNRDVFLSKFDAQGKALWTRQFGTSDDDTATGLAADASGVYVVGRTDGALPSQTGLGSVDAFVRKYDVNGNELWTRQFGTSNFDEALGAAVDATGFYVAGRTSGALPGQTSGSLGQDDAFVRKYGPSGNEVWTRQFGTSSGDRAYGVAVDASGVYVAGSTGGPLVSEAAGTDGFVRKYDSNGTVVWTRQIASAGTGNDTAYGVSVGTSGVYVSGDTTGIFTGQSKIGGLFDAWARKFDLNGNEQWTRQFGTIYDDYGYGISVAQRWVYVAVYGSSWELVLKRFDLNGGDTGGIELSADRNFGYAVATDASGAYLAGSKDGDSLGQTPLGDLDALVLKVPHPPEITKVGNAFGESPTIAPNTWVAIKGTNLASNQRIWLDADFVNNRMPTTLDGVTVTMNGSSVFAYYISSAQLNVLTPPDLATGPVQVVVTNNGSASAPFSTPGQPLSLSFFVFDGVHVTGTHLTGSLLGPTSLYPGASTPAAPNEILILYANGFGPTSSPVVSGAVVQSGSLPELPVVKIGGATAEVRFAGLVSPGLFQFNVVVPPSVPDGDNVITATYKGLTTQTGVVLAVQH